MACRSFSALVLLLAAGCATEAVDPNKSYYFVDVEFTVGTDGKTTDAKVIRTDAPKALQKEALAEVSRYRADPAAQPTKGRRTIEFAVDPGE